MRPQPQPDKSHQLLAPGRIHLPRRLLPPILWGAGLDGKVDGCVNASAVSEIACVKKLILGATTLNLSMSLLAAKLGKKAEQGLEKSFHRDILQELQC